MIENVVSGQYLYIERVWNGENVIRIDMDMRCRMISAKALIDDPEAADHFALVRGALVLSREARLGDDVDTPVAVVCDESGYVDARVIGGLTVNEQAADFPTLVTLEVPLKNGKYLKVCDCSSAGKTWDTQSRMAIWMNMQKK